jgi:hypothetical protein
VRPATELDSCARGVRTAPRSTTAATAGRARWSRMARLPSLLRPLARTLRAECATLLACSTSTAGVTDIAWLLPGAGRPTRIEVLTFAAFVATSIATDLAFRSVLLLARYGLLVAVCRIRLALFRRVSSTLMLAGLHGMLAFLMSPCSFLAFRTSIGVSVLVFSVHGSLRS